MSFNSWETAEEFIAGLRYPEEGLSIFAEVGLDAQLTALKARAVAQQNEQEANRLWCAQTIADVQRSFTCAFAKLKSGEFYDAWCEFERCEIALGNLLVNFETDESDLNRLKYIECMLERWQGLYPYAIFGSPEFLEKRIVCSVCKQRVTPRANCGHKKGNLYGGEICYHIVEEMDVISFSFVKQPVQRYSVPFATNKDGTQYDQYDYSNLKFVVDRVVSPFHGWVSEKTVRLISASELAHLSAESLCPCASQKRFGECCIDKQEFEVSHREVRFFVPPPQDLPDSQLLY